MKSKSAKSHLQLFIAALLFLSSFYIVTLLFSLSVKKADQKYHQVVKLEKDFSTSFLNEKMSLKTPDSYRQIQQLYEEFSIRAEQVGLEKKFLLIDHRLNLLKKILNTRQNIGRQHQLVKGLLPDMAQSVRYIHEHHIVYLKNLLRRGRSTQDWDIGKDFKRSPVKAAPELDIINAAVEIQNRLLDVFAVFYKLFIGEQPSALKKEFRDKIVDFYAAVNTFEDYSLDAQDGLLVEELLINGRLFEKSFTILLTAESDLNVVSGEIADNSIKILSQFSKQREKLEARRIYLEKGLLVIRYISILIFLAVIAGLIIYLYRIMTAFKRTREETQKIQEDISYQIPINKKDYKEFRAIFDALNVMAKTIETQINDLSNARNLLETKVLERTKDLKKANIKLKKEIQERIESVSARIELENKLNRAQKMEAIGLLAGGVAHDLNNLLSGVVGYPDLILLKLPDDSPLRDSVLNIKKTGEKAAAIVQDLLTLSRRGISVSEIVNINTLIKEFLESPELKKIKTNHNNVRIETKLNPELLNIMGSPVHLSKTLMNLILNACEAISGEGTIYIETDNRYVDQPIPAYDNVQEGDYAMLSITDNGIGISKDDIERIFEPFYSKKVMGRSGTGLGMAVVWGTIKDHDGYIDINSEEHRGTRVTIYLPVSRDAQKQSKKELILNEIKGYGQKILVIDDVKEQREIASQMLEALGYEAEVMPSGEQAIEYVKDHCFDLILLDMIMDPGINGLETYKGILKIHPNQKAIIASGYSESDQVKEALRLGAGAYIRKPYTLKNLAVAVYQEILRTSN